MPSCRGPSLSQDLSGCHGFSTLIEGSWMWKGSWRVSYKVFKRGKALRRVLG